MEIYSLIMPMYGGSRFARLAVDSLIRHSSMPARLLLVVEPANTEEDDAWLRSLPDAWPGPLRIMRNPERLGYYATVNRGVHACETDMAVIFTTDQVAAPEWDRCLLEAVKPRRFVTGRLVESGANLIADGNLWKNFGYQPEEFDEQAFVHYCRTFQPDRWLDLPRHYIPMAFHVKDFIDAGMFREVWDTGNAKTTREDFDFFLRVHRLGFELVEVQKPLSYHFQSGSRKGRFRYSFLNAVYPYGLKHVHRWLTGYVSPYNALWAQGARVPET